MVGKDVDVVRREVADGWKAMVRNFYSMYYDSPLPCIGDYVGE